MVSRRHNSKKLAIISVSDKTGIDNFAKKLIDNNYRILSTGGTADFLTSKRINNISIADFTDFDEILEGRVKTLHPKIHAGILAKNQKLLDEIKNSSYMAIDLVVVNLYPFEKTINKKNSTFNMAIENIDIGGPTMLRAAAKNHQRVTVITDPNDYEKILEEINRHGKTKPKTRLDMAIKAFEKTARYDSIICDYLSPNNKKFPEKINITMEKLNDLRYGENPHQEAALYDIAAPIYDNFNFEQLSGKDLSFNNIVDTESALACVRQFDKPACVIVKHANPCGVSESTDSLSAYNRAYKTDPISAFGGIIAFNKIVDAKVLKKILSQQFVEVIIAPGFKNLCLNLIKKKPNIRLLKSSKVKNDKVSYELKSLGNKLLLQNKDDIKLKNSDLRFVTKKRPTKNQIEDLIFAFKVARYVKSNAIVFVKNKKTLGIGAGQMSRIDSTKIAQMKAKRHKLSLKGSVMASEAFFPFKDNVDLAKKIGVSSIIQPGGSIKDTEIIKIVDKHKMSMVFSGIRVFKH
tara:strand:- start:322 stop:1878 length:1557 start_codon:yes stop_codon:yes gene_type:complete